jgi:hypothetical protein
MLYLLLKWLHVLAAIVAVGANVTYGIWIAGPSRHPEALSFTLRGIKLNEVWQKRLSFLKSQDGSAFLTSAGGPTTRCRRRCSAGAPQCP